MLLKVFLQETATGEKRTAHILPAEKKDMPLKKDGWQFNWRELFKTKGAKFYKIVLEDTPNKLESLLMVSLLYEKMFYMNNVEVAPHNLGKNKKYDLSAACLIAFACLESFDKGKDDYKGFLSFESKTELIPFYINKYGAIYAGGQRLFIDADTGEHLIKKYLKITINLL